MGEGEGRRPQDGSGGAETSDASPTRESRASAPTRCELCGGRTVERHCKIVCLRCGFKRDCSDP